MVNTFPPEESFYDDSACSRGRPAEGPTQVDDRQPTPTLLAARETMQRQLEELRQSEQRFHQVSENSGEWIWEVDGDGLYIYSSPSVEKILGYPPQEIVGRKHFYDFFPSEMQNNLTEEGFAIFERKATFRELENPKVHKDGHIVFLETSGLPVLDKAGNLLGYRGLDIDVTARKQAENNLRQLAADLELRVAERTNDLAESNRMLQAELATRKQVEKALKKRELEVRERSRKLEETNIALQVLLNRIDEDKKDLERKLLSNVKHLISPYIEKLRKNHISNVLNETYLNIIETQLNNLLSPFSHKLSAESLALTPREIQVAELIREGKTSKEIAEILHISKGVADFHRDHIRSKLGIKNNRGNLRTYLLSIR